MNESVMMKFSFCTGWRLLVFAWNPIPTEILDDDRNLLHISVGGEEVIAGENAERFRWLDTVIIGKDVKSALAGVGTNQLGEVGLRSEVTIILLEAK